MAAGAQQRDTGPKGASALVFIHGSGDSARVWDAVIERLPGWQTVALDLPGHGALLDRPGPTRMGVEDYAAALRAELARRDLAHVCLVGHSLGSAIALWLAMEQPALVRRLVLVGAGARLRVLPALLEQARTDAAAAGDALSEMGFAAGHAAQLKRFVATREAAAPGMLHRDLAACDGFDMLPDLGRIAQPTLLITGAQDRLTPTKYATYLRDHLADARLQVVAGAGHYVQIEAPEAVAAAIKSWLA